MPDTDRREQIHRALAEADGFDYDHLEPHDYQRQADAVLAVLPETVDRAAVLREAADRFDRQADGLGTPCGPYGTAITVMRATATELRRMADEPQQAEAHPPTTGWIVEYRTGDSAWTYLGTYSRKQADAMAMVCELVRQELETRLLRATTTYTTAAEEAQR